MADERWLAARRDEVRDLRESVRAARGRLRDFIRDLDRLNAGLAHLEAVRAPDPHVGARLARLEGVLDAERIGAHFRSAASAPVLNDTPAPHVRIPHVLPEDVYAAIVETLPPSAQFVAAGEQRRELALPPRLAPVDTIIAWRLLSTVIPRVAAETLAGPFAAMLAGRPLAPLLARLVLRHPGYRQRSHRARPQQRLTLVLPLIRAAEEPYGSVLAGSAAHDAIQVPFARNTMLAVFDAAGAHEYASVPDTASDTGRVAYEVSLGER